MIRDYKPEDADAAVAVWQAASELAHPFLDKDFLEQEAVNLREIYLVHASTRVVEIDGNVEGFIAMIGNEIGGLFLSPELHGRGLGRALVDDVRHLGELEVEVFERNSVGRRFYDQYGFENTDESIHEATGEVVLRLRLAAAPCEVAA